MDIKRKQDVDQEAIANNDMLSESADRHTSIVASSSNNMTHGRKASSTAATVGRRRASMFDPIDPAELQTKLYKSDLGVSTVSKTKLHYIHE